MRVLFVSGELIGGDLCFQLKKEGCEVKLYIEDESRKDCFVGMVEKIDDWKKEIDWVGKDGLIVFDDVGYGEDQENLRSMGYNVFGGSVFGDKLEQDRNYGQKIFSVCGIKIVSSNNFDTVDDAIDFVRFHKGEWVVKQDGHLGFLNYVGGMESGEDVISVLGNYKKYGDKIKATNLQKKIKGVEIGIARYFNGHAWVGPIEFNVEHKDLCNGNIGPKTGEMGTVMWLSDDENNALYKETLIKVEPFLKHANFKGDIDINCIVNEDGVFPLEATTRIGCPAIQLQDELFLSPWHELLSAVAKGEEYDLKYKKGYGVIVSIAIPPFPYKSVENDYYLKDVAISFKKKLSEKESAQIHFEEVSCKDDGTYCVAGSNGYILYISGSGETISDARKEAYGVVDKVVLPKMFYRTDIGVDFEDNNKKLLEKWGWI